jgi:hypothetical protein
MGLDTTHNCWHGAYSAFGRWRQMMAEVAGYAVWDVMVGRPGSAYPKPAVMIDWGHVTEANLMGEWEATPADPLLVLIAHADDDGRIYPEQARPLADRLEALLPLLPATPGLGHVGDWRVTTQRFIDGLRAAAAAGEPVEFH